MAAVEIISAVLGWSYVVCWSLSFYPQAYLNFSRKSVTGLSIDFVVASVIGFFCYSVFTVSFYFISSIQEEYKLTHGGQSNLIQFNDVFFSVHALILTSVYLLQVFLFRKKEEKLSIAGALSCGGVCTALVVLTSMCAFNLFSWLNLMYVMSYVKLVLTITKYIPQVYMNYLLKSTVGWHVQNVILDFAGGILSIAQLFLDAFTSGDIEGIKGISAKLILGLVSIIFDIIFMVQHYVWYREQPHQRVLVATAVEKNSELASSLAKTGAPAPAEEQEKEAKILENIAPTELEAQRRSVEPKI